jgi:5-formyltetrahydrofolate cyclo-ligase
MNESIKEAKRTAREQARLHRDRIERIDTDFETIIDVFFDYFNPSQDKIISAYWPVGKEFDCRYLLDELSKRGFQCALPCLQKGSRVLQFHLWDHNSVMEKNAIGIPEPQGTKSLEPDIVLAPLLAFDQKGYRLGQGGGYYDATIGNLRRHKEITYIGLGYAEQAVLLKLPREEHDIPLDYVVTPKGVMDFKEGQ